MKRLMCLSLLLCLGASVFSPRGYSANVNVLDVAAAGSTVPAKALTGGTTPANTVDSKGWLVGTAISDAAILNGTTLAAANTDTTLAIGSSSGSAISGALTALGMGDIVLTASDANQKFAHLLIGGFGADSTGPLADFPVAGAGQNFKAQFGTISSIHTTGTAPGSWNPLAVLTGRTAVWVGINNLVGLTAKVEGTGDTAEGNTLVLDRFELTAPGGAIGAVAGARDATLSLGTLARLASNSSATVAFSVESSAAGTGKLIFTDDVTLGGVNVDTVTFKSAADGTKAILEAQGNLTLTNLSASSGTKTVNFVTTNAAGGALVDVTKNLTIGLLTASVDLSGIDFAVDGSATIKSDATAATPTSVTLGSSFAANGVTINGSSDATGFLTVNVKSLKSGAMGAGTGSQGDPDYVAPAFVANNTITINGAASGVVLAGTSAVTNKIEASVINVLNGGAYNATLADNRNNQINNLTVAADLVVGTADAPAYLTVTTSKLNNLTQGQGKTTIAAGTEIAGMTMVFGKKEFQKAL